jgi:hypothetical protein
MPPLPILSAAAVDPRAEPTWADRVPASMKRRDPRIWQLAHTAAMRAIDNAGQPPRSIVVATALGALDETAQFLDGVFKDGFGSPRNFIASVHNSMAGKLAMELKIEGPNLTVCEGVNSLASAVVAASLLVPGEYPCLLVAADEEIELLARLRPYLNGKCGSWLSKEWADGAVAFMLDAPQSGACPALRAAGPRPAREAAAETVCRELAGELIHGAYDLIPLPQNSATFLAPAQGVLAAINSGRRGCRAIGSWAASSAGAAVVAVWH